MTPSKILFLALLSFIGGVFISSFFNVPDLIIYEIFILGIFYSLIFFKEKTILVFGICLIIFTLGILRTEPAKANLPQSPTQIYQYSTLETDCLSEKILPLKQKLREIVYQNFSPPHSSILAALVLGDKRKISQQWKQKLNIAGVRHITAISGMHIVIVSGILIWIFIVLGLSRPRAFYFVLITLWFFIFLTGLQSSAVRAGIMGSVFLLSQKLGRQKAGLRVLVMAAALMIIFNPLLLRYNIGFQLSFLAALGLIYLLPLFKNLLEKIKLFKVLDLSYLLSVTFSAQLFALPVLIYNFGYFSLASPITNILIVPILPFLMTGAFLFLLFALISQPLGWLISLPIYLLLSYLILVVNFFSKLPISYFTFQIPWFSLPIFYSFLAYFLWHYSKRTNRIIKP